VIVVPGLSAPNLVSALEANIDAQIPLMYAHMPRVRVLDEPDLLGIMTDLEPMFNGVCRANVPPDQVAARIDQVLDRFRAQKCWPMAWLIGPSTQPSDLGKHLEARGSLSPSGYLGWPPSLSRMPPVGLP
jgi:hypothetical protein